VERALNLVLTVCADHELNASTVAVTSSVIGWRIAI
jgi:citrate synthase